MPNRLARSVSASAGMPSAAAARDRVVDARQAVGDRVFAVQAEMDEAGAGMGETDEDAGERWRGC